MLVLRLCVLYTVTITRTLPMTDDELMIAMVVVKNIETALGQEAALAELVSVELFIANYLKKIKYVFSPIHISQLFFFCQYT